MMEEEGLLIYDLECATTGRPDSNKDTMRLFGCYSSISKKYHLLTKKEDIQKVINNHKFLVGFNIFDYDNPILRRHGINLDFKIMIDMYDIIKKRATIIKVAKGLLSDLLVRHTLDYITRVLDLVDDSTAKLEFDYKILNKPQWTDDDIKKIKEYTIRDLEITKKLYDWLEEYFAPFKDFILQMDIEKKKYLIDSPATFAYRVICKELNMTVEFDHNINPDEHDPDFLGGYVSYPAGEFFDGLIILFDFVSLYPNIYIQNNLFSYNCDCCTQEEKWHGDGFFNVEGYYCRKKQGQIEELLKKLFLIRKEYKRNKDRREMTIKIILNAIYGASSNPAFKNIFHMITAKDCTLIGRACILYTRKRFREEGYMNIMSDTDSLCVKIPEGKTIEDAKALSIKVCEELQSHMPFPW